MTDPEFDFHRLEVYQRAMELKPLIDAIIGQLPPGSGDLKGQMRRHERSIRFNIGEGAGKHRPGGKAERFRTARGSANECAAALDEVKVFNLADRRTTMEALHLVHRIIAMLTKLILYWEAAAASEDASPPRRRKSGRRPPDSSPP